MCKLKPFKNKGFCVHSAVFLADFFMWYNGDVPNDIGWMEHSSLKGK